MQKNTECANGARAGGGDAGPGPEFWSFVLALCTGDLLMSRALFEEPAFAFLRAINSVPSSAWDGRVAYGLVLVTLVGLQAFGMLVLGTAATTRLTRCLQAPSVTFVVGTVDVRALELAALLKASPIARRIGPNLFERRRLRAERQTREENVWAVRAEPPAGRDVVRAIPPVGRRAGLRGGSSHHAAGRGSGDPVRPHEHAGAVGERGAHTSDRSR